MKNFSNWSIVGLFGGMLFIILSTVRYGLFYIDYDKLIADVIIGVLICAVSWLYSKQLQHGNDITAIEDYLSEDFAKKKKYKVY